MGRLSRERDRKRLPPVSRYSKPRVLLCGETAVSIEFGEAIDPLVNGMVHRLHAILGAKRRPGILGMNPTYRSLLIHYDPWLCSYESLLLLIDECLEQNGADPPGHGRTVEIPVCYGGEFGPDIEYVAGRCGLSPGDVAALHGRPLYRVYMIGFTPGFPYLGGMDERLFTPRKTEISGRVPAGSIGVADRQTGIYPIESPGGWWLIGRTPVKLFDLLKPDPFIIAAGDRVKFRPIEKEEFGSYSNH